MGGGWGWGGYTAARVPKVTLLYTLLNLTGMDVALGGRATVESEKRKVGQHALQWITHFTEREWHPPVFFPSEPRVTHLCFQAFNILALLDFFFFSRSRGSASPLPHSRRTPTLFAYRPFVSLKVQRLMLSAGRLHDEHS